MLHVAEYEIEREYFRLLKKNPTDDMTERASIFELARVRVIAIKEQRHTNYIAKRNAQ